jgi:hypothetical protein
MWFALATALASASTAGEGSTPSAAVHRILESESPPKLDGELSDAIWQSAGELGPLTQVEPVRGAAPSERTVVKLCYDANNLYLALWCDDSDPAGIRATQMQRDANLDPDDRVEILIDPFLDRRNAFWFQIGAAGSLGDALVTRNGATFNKPWDGIFHGHARITERGWQAELAIPFATINFDPKQTAWGFNLRRFIRRRTEEARWASADPRIAFFWVANAGTLTGLEGLEQGLGIDVAPFAVGRRTRDHATDDDGEDLQLGADVFWKITPQTKLALSLNTDFAETEVDERRVNLTRFPLFFPERRDFFLEDSGVFQFGGSTDVIPFFSRRIGLDQNREKVPIDAAAKLTGQTDGWTFGVLDAQTGDSDTQSGQNLFTTRVSRNIFGQSDVGVILTHGDPDSDSSAQTYGADLNLRTNEFLGDSTLRWNSYLLKSDNAGDGGKDLAWAGRLSYPNDQFNWSVGTATIEEDFDPKLGFVARTGIRRHDGTYTWRPRLFHDVVRQYEAQVDANWVTGIDGETQTFEVEVQPFGLYFESNDSVRLECSSTREVLLAPFEIQDGLEIPTGDYRFDRVRLEAETSDRRELSIEGSFSTGQYWDGDADEWFAALAWRPIGNFQTSAEWERTDAALDAGDFTVDVARLRFALYANNDVSWTNYVQWDTVSEQVGWNSRLWWIFWPGTQAYLVLNQGWSSAGPTFAATTTEVALKFGTTLRF